MSAPSLPTSLSLAPSPTPSVSHSHRRRPPTPSPPSLGTPLAPAPVARWRAWTLLLIFSMAQMIDIFNVTAPTIGLPDIARDLDVAFAERQWAINAYSLTFGAFLLTGGRFSAILGPKTLFVAGFAAAGVCAIICGFAVDGPMLFVFRALQGIGAAMTIPSALTMITTLFPERGAQDRALGIFGAFGAMGNVSGLVLGGVISQLLSWRWIFYIIAIATLPLAALTAFLAPRTPPDGTTRLRETDWLGLATITLALILFVYAVTEGNTRGWATGGILAPLIIAVALIPTFALIEKRAGAPLVPPAVWTLPGFVPLFFVTMSLYWAMNVVIFQESLVFQQVWHTSALSAALRIIPFGITGFLTTMAMGHLTPHLPARFVLVAGELIILAGVVLLACAPTPNLYWPRVMPGIVLVSLGMSSGFVAANIGILRTPLAKPSVRLPESTALLGAIFNADLQFGSALGLAVATAITSRVDGADPGRFAGYRASYWFVVGLVAAEALLAAVTLRERRAVRIESAGGTMFEGEKGSAGSAGSAGEIQEKEREEGEKAMGEREMQEGGEPRVHEVEVV